MKRALCFLLSLPVLLLGCGSAAAEEAHHSIPYHMAPGKLFDQKRAEQFDAPNRLIVPAGEEIILE